MTVSRVRGIHNYQGLSSDQKPVTDTNDRTLPVGSTFTETDTGDVYRFDGVLNWTKPRENDEQLQLLREITLQLAVIAKLMETRHDG